MNTTKKRLSSDMTTVILHWILVITLLISLSTGFRIALDHPENQWYMIFDALLLQGEVIHWHVWSAYGFFLISMSYIVFLIKAKLVDRIKVDRYTVKNLKNSDSKIRWMSLNRVIYWLGFVLIIGVTITGVLLYVMPQAVSYSTVTSIHEIIAWGIIIYALLHIISQLALGGIRQLLKIMTPRLAYGFAAVVTIATTSIAAATVYYTDKLNTRSLTVAKITTPPSLDGVIDDAVWDKSQRIAIPTVRGVNHKNDEGEVIVYLRALHDGENIYTTFEWQDKTRSQKHLPLIKTEQGWKVVQTEYGIQDEDDYYEDKFGVMLSTSGEIAGNRSIHMGHKPLDNKPGPAGGRGLHYTLDNSIVDVWHWKSVRTGSTAMNQIDDNYFGAPLTPNEKHLSGKKRYTGGYTKDPKTGGGFTMNWKSFNDGIVQPKRLPKDPKTLDQFKTVSLNPNDSDKASLWLAFEETVPYSKELDNYPVGTLLPAVLVKGEFIGDRGDVTAVSQWKDGWWRMEVTRKLDTGSKYDIAFSNDKPVYLWVAAFDHAQTRHTQHLHPIELELE